MGENPFIVKRSAFFSIQQLECMEEAALRILDEIGIAVLDEEILEQLLSCGFQANGNRVTIEQSLVSDFLDAERKNNGDQFSEEPVPVKPSSHSLNVGVNQYSQWVHDIESDEVIPFDTDRLIEATKLLDVLSLPGVPGCPVDVPPPLQPIVQYWVSATYSRNGRSRVDPKSMETLPYIMEMSEVLGNPLRSLPVYVFTPLSLGGESLKCVLKFKDRLSSIGVSDMASLGCTTPMNVGDAFALCAAEVIGSAMLLREVVDIPVGWGVRLCPMDLRTLAMALGTPEDFLLQLANPEVNAYFHGTAWYPASGIIHTNAKFPGAQACAEKASIMTAGALLGARSFGAVGALSLDEVFSAEQLIYDLEIRDHVERMVRGIDGDCDPERCVRDVEAGIQQKSFVALETTVNAYRDFYWHPKLFDRQFFSAWEGEGAVTNRQKAHAMVRELLGQYEYELEPELQRELDKILAKAKAELAG
jgi:trimethylamine:corrinoid methyltransferase-like protein